MRLSIVGCPFGNAPVFGLSHFTCSGEDGSTCWLVLVGGQYYMSGFDWVDFNRPASPVYRDMPNGKLRLIGFEI